MSGPEEVKAWLAKAESDELAIDNILAGKRVPWDVVCYHAQQQAEKLLKAWVVAHGVVPRRTHDLVALLALCCTFDENLGKLQDDCRMLVGFATDVRYPGTGFAPSNEEGLAAVAAAQRIKEAVLSRLPPNV